MNAPIINIDNAPYIIMDQLYKLRQKDPEEFKNCCQRTAELAIQFKKTYLAYRLARELYNLGKNIAHIEDYVATQTRDPYIIYRFAYEFKNASVSKLEEAIIRSGNMEYIAKFACSIRRSNTMRLEEILQKSKNARAIYVYITYNKHADIEKFRHVLFNSRRPRYLYALAKRTTCPKQIEAIGDLILKGKSNMYVRLFAANVPGANLEKCEDRIIQTGSVREYRNYISHVPSEKIRKLLLLC